MPFLAVFFFLLPPGLRPWPPLDAQTAALVREARDRNQAVIAAVRPLPCRSDQSCLGRYPDRTNPEEFAAELNGWDIGWTWIRRSGIGGPPDTPTRGRESNWYCAWRPLLCWDQGRVAVGMYEPCLFACWEIFVPIGRPDSPIARLSARSLAVRRLVEDGAEWYLTPFSRARHGSGSTFLAIRLEIYSNRRATG